MPDTSLPSLAVFYTVWNRGDLFSVSLASLLPRLEGVEAGIWIFDNGSDRETKRVIENVSWDRHSIFKIAFPRNMGIPYALNVFGSAVTQASTFACHNAPDYVAIFDGDMFFKHSLRSLIDILAGDPSVAILSGHDSVEHAASERHVFHIGSQKVIGKTKKAERGCFYLMRTETLLEFLPLPHHTPYDIDWQMTILHERSLAKTGRRLLCIDSSVHLGLFDSTWNTDDVPASHEQVFEIIAVLEDQKLMTKSRYERALAYISKGNLPIELMPAKKSPWRFPWSIHR
ncbi:MULTISPECIES: glycosyltransferase family A protein [unclassified Beijerinckia]|uniref:glycosyltransferase family A protein n=1 Tax=unclassified Beijerinckia TaxID=2638183 RepID=UPI00089CCFBB|nr:MULTISPECIES: glycosyltransferase family A protein [unclassified Beijerinckia]MDH7795594.1 hypothetical protein [Beijerinckia sp. GAS462]SEC08060.1 Glycosyl transferase family 2 [Beijerinckia sp. 28-YEA-48]